MAEQIDQLNRQLGYTFLNQSLLIEALSHRSYGGRNNERLEFLGDAILNFVIAAELFQRYPYYSEGELSRLRASLVMGETLSQLGKELGIGRFIFLGAGEKKSGGAQRKSILADAFEAIIGAIYLDQGYAVCQQKILDWFTVWLADENLCTSTKDAKTRLQEFLQAKQIALPVYDMLEITGEDHAQLFTVECCVIGFAFTTKGTGTSRRKAEQNAAQLFLELLLKDGILLK